MNNRFEHRFILDLFSSHNTKLAALEMKSICWHEYLAEKIRKGITDRVGQTFDLKLKRSALCYGEKDKHISVSVKMASSDPSTLGVLVSLR